MAALSQVMAASKRTQSHDSCMLMLLPCLTLSLFRTLCMRSKLSPQARGGVRGRLEPLHGHVHHGVAVDVLGCGPHRKVRVLGDALADLLVLCACVYVCVCERERERSWGGEVVIGNVYVWMACCLPERMRSRDEQIP